MSEDASDIKKREEILLSVNEQNILDDIDLQIKKIRQIWPNTGALVGKMALFTIERLDYNGNLFTRFYDKLNEAGERSLAKAVTQAATICCGLVLSETVKGSGDIKFKLNKMVRNGITEEVSYRYIDFLLGINPEPPIIGFTGSPLKMFLKLLVSDNGKITVKIPKPKKASGSSGDGGSDEEAKDSGSSFGFFTELDKLITSASNEDIKSELETVKELVKSSLSEIMVKAKDDLLKTAIKDMFVNMQK